MEEIGKWVKVNTGYGYGDDYGDGDGFGDGFGDGSGYGSGYGYGYGFGYGYGYGDGYGDGDGFGYGYGDDYGYKINNNFIYNIDGIGTIVNKVKSNVATGFIVNKDLSLTKTYIVKDLESKHFSHGNTIKEAFINLEEKIIANLDVDERIEMFLNEVDKNKKYKFQYFFDWHGKLTGSCLQGRESFIKNKGLSLDDEINFNEFIEICRNKYGWEIIKQLT